MFENALSNTIGVAAELPSATRPGRDNVIVRQQSLPEAGSPGRSGELQASQTRSTRRFVGPHPPDYTGRPGIVPAIEASPLGQAQLFVRKTPARDRKEEGKGREGCAQARGARSGQTILGLGRNLGGRRRRAFHDRLNQRLEPASGWAEPLVSPAPISLLPIRGCERFNAPAAACRLRPRHAGPTALRLPWCPAIRRSCWCARRRTSRCRSASPRCGRSS